MPIPARARACVLLAGLLLMTCSSAAAGYDHVRYVGKKGVELHDRRQPSARHYRAPDGRTVAVITAVPTDFRGDAGSWQRIRPEASSAADGTSQALENAIRMHSHESGITSTSTGTDFPS